MISSIGVSLVLLVLLTLAAINYEADGWKGRKFHIFLGYFAVLTAHALYKGLL